MGTLSEQDLVWQEGTPAWVTLAEVLPRKSTPMPSPQSISRPIAHESSNSLGLPDYGDILCWGILAVMIPCLGLVAMVTLIVLHFLEHSAVRKAVASGSVPESDYSKIHPALFLLGMICCGILFYPLLMHWRNKSNLFKKQPYAVIVAIVAAVLTIGVSVVLNLGNVLIQSAANHSY